MRKYLLLFFLLPLITIGSFAQEKLFNEAISRGLTANGFYCVENPKNKNVTLEEMRDYAKSRGYIIGKATEKQIIRCGDSKYLIDKMEIIDPKDYSTYVFHSLAGSDFDFNRLKGKGAFFVPEEEKVYEKTQLSFISVLSGTRTKFNRYDNALWTGNVSSGLLDGNGTGFVARQGGIYIKFEGTFSKGFPTTVINAQYVSKNDMSKAFVDNKEIKTTHYDAVSQRSFAQNVETTDEILKQALNLRMEVLYEEDVSKLEAIYNKAKTISISNYENVPIDLFVVEFITLYQTAKYDPKGALPKAWELNDVFYVTDALKMKIRDQYYGYSAWSLLTMFYDWLDKAENNDRKLLSTGIDKARKGKTDSKYGFKNFFSQAEDRLTKKKADFEDKISKDIAIYNKMVDKEREKRRQIEEELSKQINWEKSKYPSGELTSSLLSSHWWYDEPGEIRFKAGTDVVNYNAYYYDRNGTDLESFQIIYASDNIKASMGDDYYKSFKNMKEMVEAISKAVR